MRDQLLQVPRGHLPRIREVHLREAGEFVLCETIQLEAAATARELDLGSIRLDVYRGILELPSYLDQLLGGDRDGTFGLHVGRDGERHRDVQIGTTQLDRALARTHQDIREDGQGGSRGDGGCDGSETAPQALPGNGEFHLHSDVVLSGGSSARFSDDLKGFPDLLF
jgi:hypothetical protein